MITAEPPATFEISSPSVAVHDYIEVTARPRTPPEGNPFTGAALIGKIWTGRSEPIEVHGFCDSEDGSVYRLRFMPTRPGAYRCEATYRCGGLTAVWKDTFRARPAKRKGVLRVDKAYPWHFIWDGTGEHYYWNGAIAYAMLGLSEPIIRASIDRLARLKVNRIRAALYPPRVKDGMAWHEPVYPTADFNPITNPWRAARPGSVEDPGFDVSRFNVEHWQKYERLLAHARSKDMVVSVIFYVDGARPGTDPFGKNGAGGDAEKRYYRYAAARLSAFSNITWDVTNEYHLFRDEAWVNTMAGVLKEADPYDHLMSVHGHGEFPFRSEAWADFAMHQAWDSGGGHGFILGCREKQRKAGRIIPQINEEYGYEDHYPHWGGDPTGPPARSADNRRRLAWAIAMAGGYQTTGERANDGKGGEARSGGGWVNGRGDVSMTMLEGYAHIVSFFTKLEWWKLDPRDDLVSAGAMCLADPGRCYVAYLPEGAPTSVTLEGGPYRAQWYDPRQGRYAEIGEAAGPMWVSPKPPFEGDAVVLLAR